MDTFRVKEVVSQLTLEEKAQLCSGRDFWKTQDVERLGIPCVMMCDASNGLRKQLGIGDHLGINESIKTVCYPTASAVASSFDCTVLYDLGEVLGKECVAENVGMLLGPGINMKRSPLCGRNFEYYSEDPYLSGELGASYIKGLQSTGTASCVKHFAANNQETRRMSGNSCVDVRSLHEIYLTAFEKVVKEGKPRSIMCAYNAVNGTFCSENKTLLSDILREEFGFEGFVVSDWGAVKDRVKGIQAGLDLEMPGSTEGKTEKIIKAVESGALSMEDLDKAVTNILTFVNDAIKAGGDYDPDKVVPFDREAAHEKAGDIEAQCAVLLKNEGDVLPLSKEQKILFVGEFASSPRYQGGGSSHVNAESVVSVLDVAGEGVLFAKGYSSEETDPDSDSADSLRAQAVSMAKDADVCVVFAGLPESYEIEGDDRTNIDLPANQNKLISEIAATGTKTVVVLHLGSAVVLPWRNEVSSILCMYLGGDRVGKAEADILFGAVNPSGKLAETWPLKVEDNPSYLNFPGEDGNVEYHEGIYIGYRYYDKKAMDVQYPFGYGLSYTSFAYSDLKLSADTLGNEDTITAVLTVTNTGKVAGKEVVELYTGTRNSAVRRPIRELKGFEKVSLEPGESKEVTFTIDARSFAYYEPRVHDWFLESSEGVIEIGASSRDIRLSAPIRIVSSQELPMTVTKLTTIGELTKTAKGRAFFAQFTAGMGLTPDAQSNETDDAMGAGSKEARIKMMMEMPLGSLVTYGVMQEEALDGIIAGLNS